MQELPEAKTIATQLNQTVIGKKIISVTANHSPHKFAFFFGDPMDYEGKLKGKKIDRATYYAGFVEMELGNIRILLGDGVNTRYYEPDVFFPEKHQLALEFEDHSHLVCSVQMYGGIWVYEEGQNDNEYYRIAKSKPTPLQDDFDESYFQKLYQACKPNVSSKAFLATEQRIPGLGNGTLQDILFEAKVHPKTKLGQLTKEEMHTLFYQVKHIMKQMTEQNGRDTEKDLFGNPGQYHVRLSKLTVKDPCPVCQGSLTKETYLGGTIYYCPSCQPLKE